MFSIKTISYRWVVGSFLTLGMLSFGSSPVASAADHANKPSAFKHDDIREVQKSLSDKGFDVGPVDGHMGPRTRSGISQYQKSENLPVTGRLDAETAGKLGVGPESTGGNLSGAGHDVAQGSKELAHEVKQGKPVAAGKEFGKGIGRAAQKIGGSVVDAVSPESDRGSREEQEKKAKQ